MATKKLFCFLLQWILDNSLSVVIDTSIKGGDKVVGGNVKATFQKKTYQAIVLKIGECLTKFVLVSYDIPISLIEVVKI